MSITHSFDELDLNKLLARSADGWYGWNIINTETIIEEITNVMERMLKYIKKTTG